MERAEKAELIQSLSEAFSSSTSIVVAHYAGLTVANMEDLRVQMKQAGGQVKVAKNRLAKLALKQTDKADISDLFNGPTLVAYSDDPVTAPKVAAKFADKNKLFKILGGAMDQTLLDPDGIKALAALPSLDELRAKIAGLLTQPAAKIAIVTKEPGGQIARVLSAYAEESAAA